MWEQVPVIISGAGSSTPRLIDWDAESFMIPKRASAKFCEQMQESVGKREHNVDYYISWKLEV